MIDWNLELARADQAVTDGQGSFRFYRQGTRGRPGDPLRSSGGSLLLETAQEGPGSPLAAPSRPAETLPPHPTQGRLDLQGRKTGPSVILGGPTTHAETQTRAGTQGETRNPEPGTRNGRNGIDWKAELQTAAASREPRAASVLLAEPPGRVPPDVSQNEWPPPAVPFDAAAAWKRFWWKFTHPPQAMGEVQPPPWEHATPQPTIAAEAPLPMRLPATFVRGMGEGYGAPQAAGMAAAGTEELPSRSFVQEGPSVLLDPTWYSETAGEIVGGALGPYKLIGPLGKAFGATAAPTLATLKTMPLGQAFRAVGQGVVRRGFAPFATLGAVKGFSEEFHKPEATPANVALATGTQAAVGGLIGTVFEFGRVPVSRLLPKAPTGLVMPEARATGEAFMRDLPAIAAEKKATGKIPDWAVMKYGGLIADTLGAKEELAATGYLRPSPYGLFSNPLVPWPQQKLAITRAGRAQAGC